MSDQLSLEARAIVRAARGGDQMSPEAKARLRATLAGRIAAGASGGGSSAPPASAKIGGIGLLTARLGGTTVVALALVILGAAGGGVVLRRASAHAMAPVAETQPSFVAPPAEAPTWVAELPQEAPPATEPTSLAGERSLKAESPPPPALVRRPRAAIAGSTASPHALPPSSSLEQELAVLREAQSALRDKDAGRAAALLESYRSAHPGGALEAERIGAQIVARCTESGSADAHAAAERFLRNNPHSPLAARVRAACGAP